MSSKDHFFLSVRRTRRLIESARQSVVFTTTTSTTATTAAVAAGNYFRGKMLLSDIDDEIEFCF